MLPTPQLAKLLLAAHKVAMTELCHCLIYVICNCYSERIKIMEETKHKF